MMGDFIANIVENGQSNYSIVYAKDAGPAVKQAAKEIQEYVCKATGVCLQEAFDTEIEDSEHSCVISLGRNQVFSKSGLLLENALLKNDGFFIKTKGCSIFLTGKTDRGTLYAAYEFLEKFVGIKFLAFDYTYIPKLEKLALFETDIIDNPHFSDRTFLINKVMTDGPFASKMRMVNEFVTIDESHGGSLRWFKDPAYISNYVHNTICYVPPETYFEDHKDWFFEDGGIPWEVHFSNVGLTEDGHVDETLEISPIKIAVENLKKFIVNSPSDIKYFMVGQNDHDTTCQCEKCLLEEKKYKRSGMNIRFVNAMSEEIDKWMKAEGIEREIYFCTFAYQYSQSAPVDESGKPLDKTVIPRDNVIVRMAPIRADNYYSMTDEKQNETTRKMFLEWANVAKRTMIWDYHTNYTFYFAYYPTMHVWKKNLKLYKDMGCEYIFMQSNHSEVNDWKATMENYVASKMLWNSDLDPFALRKEYISYYYHGIEDLVESYIQNFEDNYDKKMNGDDVPLNTLQCGRIILHPKYYGIDFLNVQFTLLEKMYARIATLQLSEDEYAFLKKQVDRMKLSALYTQVVGIVYFDCKEYYQDDQAEKQKIISSFFELCESLGVTHTGETVTLAKFREICENGVV